MDFPLHLSILQPGEIIRHTSGTMSPYKAPIPAWTVIQCANSGLRIHWLCLMSIIATLEMWGDHFLEEILDFWLGLRADWLIFWLHVT